MSAQHSLPGLEALSAQPITVPVSLLVHAPSSWCYFKLGGATCAASYNCPHLLATHAPSDQVVMTAEEVEARQRGNYMIMGSLVAVAGGMYYFFWTKFKE